MERERPELRLGKGSAFVKSRLKRLRQDDDTWEADFHALPKPPTQNEPYHVGLVVTKRGDLVLAHSLVEDRPTANDLAALLAQAMQRPLTGMARRPICLHVRGTPRWKELFPHLKELGIGVSVKQELPKVEKAYDDYLQHRREARRARMDRLSKQAAIEQMFPAIAKWVSGYGHIEIGDQEGFGFIVRALDQGGLVFKDDKPDTLAEALAALEKGLAEWFENEGSSDP